MTEKPEQCEDRKNVYTDVWCEINCPHDYCEYKKLLLLMKNTEEK